MKITERVKAIDGVHNAYWDGKTNELTIYYTGVSIDAVKVKVADSLRGADVIDSINKISLIEV